MSNPSLILPQSPAYGEDYVYAAQVEDGAVPLYNVLPLTFTRASGGTRINKDGLVQNMPYNLLQYSEDFDNGVWLKYGTGTVTTNTATAPNGTTTADKFTPNTTNTTHACEQNMGTTSGAIIMSLYAKADGYNWLCFNSYVGGFKLTWFNISTGTIGTVASGVSASIESVGNGWYRCIVSLTGGASTYFSIIPTNANNVSSFAGDGTSGILIWGAQLNIGSTAQPYLATTDRLNMPRITYPVGGGCGALLLEKQSTNLVAYSEDFTNAQYTADNATFSGNATTSPDGTIDADLLTESTSNASHGFYLPITARGTTGANLSTSVFAKQNGRRYLTLSAGFDSGNYYYAVYDLQNGVVATSGNAGSTTLVSSTIQSFGNGWFRCVLVGSTSLPNRISFAYLADNTSGLGSLGVKTYTGNGTSGVYFYGYQIEESSYATSYIPTTSTSATRIADACYKTGISNLIGQTEGVLYMDFVPQVTSTAQSHLWIGVAGNEIGLYGNTQFIFYSSGGVSINAGNFVTGTRYKIAFAYKANDYVAYINGVQVGTDTSATVPTTSALYINSYSDLTEIQTKQVNEVILYKTRLTNAELATLTTI